MFDLEQTIVLTLPGHAVYNLLVAVDQVVGRAAAAGEIGVALSANDLREEILAQAGLDSEAFQRIAGEVEAENVAARSDLD